MRRAERRRAPGAWPLTVALGQLAAFAVAFGGVELALFARQPDGPLWIPALFVVTALVYVGVGAVAWERRPSSRLGPLLSAGGFAWLLAGLANTGVPALNATGLITATIGVGIALHALLTFPSGRITGRAARVLVVAGYVTTTVLEVPLYLFGGRGPAEADPLLLADLPVVVTVARDVGSATAASIFVASGVLLARRLAAAAPPQRRVLLPIYVYGVGALVIVSFAANLGRISLVDPLVVFVVQICLLAGIPVAFAAGVLLGGFARTAELEELASWLGRGDVGLDGLRPVLGRALDDPTVALALAAGPGWVDPGGQALEVPRSRGLEPVRVEGRPVGAIVYDAATSPDLERIRAAARVIAIAVDRERLTAMLLAEQEQLRDSRARIVEAGDLERRRFARDLHDRLQGRLVLLAMRVGSLRPDSPETEVVGIRRDLDDAAAELRRVVADVMPPLLLERGLAAAVEDMLSRTPLRTALEVSDEASPVSGSDRLTSPVEGTAFHVVAEAVTNVVKHAGAQQLRVGIHRRAGMLHLDIRDDGVGGADPDGGGLRGIADRVHALGGRIDVDSPVAGGTHVAVALPCE